MYMPVLRLHSAHSKTGPFFDPKALDFCHGRLRKSANSADRNRSSSTLRAWVSPYQVACNAFDGSHTCKQPSVAHLILASVLMFCASGLGPAGSRTGLALYV